jgi:GAF domain-containing protein
MPAPAVPIWAALKEVLDTIASGGKLKTVLTPLVQAAAYLCGAQMAVLTALTPPGDALEVVSVYGAPGAVHPTRLPIVGSFNGAVIKTGRSFRCTDTTQLRPRMRSELGTQYRVRSFLIVPLRSAHGPLGTLGVVRTSPWRCTPRQEQGLHLFAAAASIALQLAGRRPGAAPSRPRRTLPRTWRQAADGPAREDISREPPHLSAREQSIVSLLIADRTYRQIGEALGLSERTVGHHVERMKLRSHCSTLQGLMSHLLTPGV